MIVATAGHVDHGKTSLIQALTGIDTDRLPEERARGMTIDLGFAYLPLGADETEVTGFIDVPGHERFVRNMLAGVAGIDVALLVVAADDGPMPQTREHLAILELLGITQGVVAITKVDRVERSRVDEVRNAIAGLLATTRLAGSAMVECAAPTGQGIAALRAVLAGFAKDLGPRAVDGHFRLSIDRSFVLEGAGRVVTGTVFSGRVAVGDHLVIAPGGLEVRVRSLHAQNRPAEFAIAGQRCGINLAGNDLRKAEIHRGDWLVAPALAEGGDRLGVQIVLAPGESAPLRDRMPVHFHLGAADITGRLHLLQDVAEPGGARHARDSAQPARALFASVQLDAPVVAVRGDRFVLRDQSATLTLAGGVVLEPLPFPGSPSRKLRCAMLEAMAQPAADAALQALVQTAPEGVDPAWFRRSWNLPVLETTLPSVELTDGRTALVDEGQWSRLREGILGAVANHHAAAPAENGASEATLLAGLPAKPSRRLFAAAVEALLREGALQRRGNAHALPGFEPQLPGPDRALLEKVTTALVRHGLQAPAVHDFCGELGLEADVLKEFLERMSRAGHLVKVGRHRYFRAVDLQRLATLAEMLASSREDGCFSAADYRDHCGIGRNTVIEVLEHFDRAGLTRRQGQVRRLRRSAAGLFAG